MSLTGKHIEAALKAVDAGSGTVTSYQEIADLFNIALLRFGEGMFKTTNQVAALLSECMMESAYFRVTEEYAKNGRYAPYIGRTFMQLTWKDNYAKFGQWCYDKQLIQDPNYFVKNPTKLADLQWAALGGVWYFTRVSFYGKPLVDYANDISQVGKAVNLGDPRSRFEPKGADARKEAFDAVRKLGGNIVPQFPPPTENKEEGFIMATGKKVMFWNNEHQPLVEGEQVVFIKKGTKDVSVVVGENAGVDLCAQVEVDNPGGWNVSVRWRVLDWKDKSPGFFRVNGIKMPVGGPVPGRQAGQAIYKADLGKPSGPGRSNRLRLYVEAVRTDPNQKVFPQINNVHIDGWKL